MVNKNLFNSSPNKTDHINRAGGPAYRMEPKHELAQLASTGCFNGTYYASDEDSLNDLKSILQGDIPLEFVEKVAVYSRKNSFMKDMPAYLVAYLAAKKYENFNRVFQNVIDNGRLLRTFIQIVRSGETGRKSFGSRIRNQIRNFLGKQSARSVFNMAVGNSPSVADIIKMVHPKPADPETSALYAYIIGKEYNYDNLPAIVKEYEEFKKDMSKKIPDIEFRYLASLPLGTKHWEEIARKMPWQATRMNLNTLLRHGVFANEEIVDIVAERLRNKEQIERARVFPYQLMMAYLNCSSEVPYKIKEALQDAMEISCDHVPTIPGNVVIAIDVSGSMHCPITGGYNSKARCIDIAAMFASAALRNNPRSILIPYSDCISLCNMNPRDSIMTNAEKLTQLPSGGTYSALPMKHVIENKIPVDAMIYFSDNESWIVENTYRWGSQATEMMDLWKQIRRANSNAKLICVDLNANRSIQVKNLPDVLNVGGWNDNVWAVTSQFLSGETKDWASIIENMEV